MLEMETKPDVTEQCDVEKALTLFVEAIELHADLEIIGTAKPINEGSEVFVIRDYSKAEGLDGAYLEVSINEIVAKVSDIEMVKQFIAVLTNERKPVVLEGVTRIVGYYSRVDNWNKSKIGELRDRTQFHYTLGGKLPEHDEERIGRINNLT